MWDAPLVDLNGTVYVINNAGQIYAINPPVAPSTTPTLKWGPVSAGAQSSLAISLDENTLYFGTSSGVNAIKTSNGNPVWTQACPIPGGSYSCPAIDSAGNLYLIGAANSTKNVYSISSSGVQNWATTVDENFGPNYSVSVGPDGNIYAIVPINALSSGEQTGSLWALKAADGSPIWNYDFPTTLGHDPSVAYDGTVYIVAGNLYAVKAFPNSNPGGPPIVKATSMPVSTSGVLSTTCSIAQDGTVYVGDTNGVMYAVKGLTSTSAGSVWWNYPTMFTRQLSYAPCIALDGTLYFGDWAWDVYSVK
jgi:outer membrane protein assembly factor BamB